MEQLTITDFLNTDYKAYARTVATDRAIPHFADGLKPVQRKALACAIANCSNRTIQIEALAGKVQGDWGYHHGPASAAGAITVMAQQFQQGMPYLDTVSQVGWLHDKRAGAPRYVSVKLSGWSKLILLDESEYDFNYDENTGSKIEPKHYLPILPMMLINGTNGIAVGYSSGFTNRNPLEVALCVQEYLKTGKLPDYQLTPFVHGHTGLWSYWNGAFESCAPWHRKNATILSIDGLPMNWQLDDYRGKLNSLQELGIIKRWDDLSTKGKCNFDIHMTETALNDLIADNAVPHMFELIYRLPKDNLTCVMPDKSLKRFEDPLSFIKQFVDWRLTYYVRRKQRLIRDIQSNIAYLDSLVRFIQLVLDNRIVLKGKNRKTLEAELSELSILPAVLNEHLYNLTDDNLAKHTAEIRRLTIELDKISKTEPRTMYEHDIANLLTHLRKFYHIEDVLNIKQELLIRIADNQ